MCVKTTHCEHYITKLYNCSFNCILQVTQLLSMLVLATMGKYNNTCAKKCINEKTY